MADVNREVTGDDVEMQENPTVADDNVVGDDDSENKKRKLDGATTDQPDPKKPRAGPASSDQTKPNAAQVIPPFSEKGISRLQYRHSGPDSPRPIPPADQGVYVNTGAATSSSIGVPLVFVNDDELDGLLPLKCRSGLGGIRNPYTMQMYEMDRNISRTRKAVVSIEQKTNLDVSVPPRSNINTIFDDIAQKLDGLRFQEACEPIANQGIRVVTMCSGTESPILALQLLQEAFDRRGAAPFNIEHLASAEIEPFKQAYIQRNFEPPILFRDVTDFSRSGDPQTAYGGTAKPPEDVHLLVAGSSCIDYSSLNNQKKGFGDDGQSYATLMGVVDYADKFRPAVVILENVEGAPWPEIQDLWEKKGYYSVIMHLDTKDFYIPQTRNRGYMVAYEKQRAQKIGLDLPKARTTFISTLKKLAQRASSPYSDFLLTDDDLELAVARRTFKAPNLHNVDWKACRIRYFAFRILHKLGIAKPFTFWKNGGKSLFRDYGWMTWAISQRERIFDTLDINFLMYLSQRHYDMSFKSRWVELSQNVDRDLDSRHWGIVGCITPSGMPFDTLRGGPVLGKESLALQGIPVDSLILNKENSRQLQDLAGNAMTSTVIGSVISSAIIAGCKNISDPIKDSKTTTTSMFEPYESLQATQTPLTDATQSPPASTREEILQNPTFADLVEREIESQDAQISTGMLKQLAADTLPLCRCDDLASGADRSFFICKSCAHTACNNCYGNPAHNYVRIDKSLSSGRQDPRDFIEMVRKALPPSLTTKLSEDVSSYLAPILGSARSYKNHDIKPDDPQADVLKPTELARYKSALCAALESTTFFCSIKQETMWRVIYESDTAHIELQITTDKRVDQLSDQVTWNEKIDCMWLLYAKPAASEPAISAVRDLLSHPAARMKPAGENILHGEWELWHPSMQYADLNIQGKGQLQPSWEQNLGLQHEIFRDLESFTQLEISASSVNNTHLNSEETSILQSLCGEFTLLANCGAACGSLYKRSEHRSSDLQPEYFFLDPKPQQNAYLDRMVFANSHNRLPYGVDRQITAELQKRWRPNSLTLSQNGQSIANGILCRLVDYWRSFGQMSFNINAIEEKLKIWSPDSVVGTVQSCESESPLLYCEIPLSLTKQPQWTHGKTYKVSLVDKPAALKEFQWFMHNVSRQLSHLGGEISWTSEIEKCDTCYPQPPALHWVHTARANFSKKGNTGKTVIVKPFEDTLEASRYEKALRERNAPLSAEAYVLENDTALVIKLNLTTTVHRLCGRLNMSSGSYKLSWRLPEYDALEPCPSFPTIALHQGSNQDVQWPVGDNLYLNEQTATRPRQFIRDLWPSQRRSLAWMIGIEEGIEWREWDAEISSAPALNLQLVVEANTAVKVRGGVIADEVGAGKTTTSLALVARSLENASGSHSSKPTSDSPNRIASNATLFLVPPNLISQWQEEIDKCFGSGRISTVILADKKNSATIQELKSAEIILAPWTIFSNDEYWKTLAEITSAPFVPKKAGRGCQQWLDTALEDLESIIRDCGPDLDVNSFVQYRKDHHEQNLEKYMKFTAFQEKNLESKQQDQLKKAASKLAKESAVPGQIESDQKEAKAEFERIYQWKPGKEIPALLHLFNFERVIVDEFTYLDPRILIALQKLHTSHPWMLSGTPPLSSAECVDVMAKLIGTRISFRADRNSWFSFKDVKANSDDHSKRTEDNQRDDKSYAEEFYEQVELQSPTWLHARNLRSKQFAHDLVRQNPAPPATVGVVEHFVVSSQSALEACIYNRCFQVLTGQPMRFGVKSTAKANAGKPAGGAAVAQDEIGQLKQMLERTHSPEEALLTCLALCLDSYLGNGSQQSDKKVFGDLIDATEDRLAQAMTTITERLQEAFWFWQKCCSSQGDSEENNPHLITYLYCVLNAAFGDPAVSDIMSRIAQYARANPKEPASSIQNKKADENKSGTKPGDKPSTQKFETILKNNAARKKELQERTVDLNERTMALVEQVQQLRLLRAIESIATGNDSLKCSCCGQLLDAEDLTLLGHCGHNLCQDCLSAGKKKFDVHKCPVEGCDASSRGCGTPASYYAAGQGSQTPKHGTQMEAVVSQIKTVNTNESIIVFIQFDAHKDRLIAALKNDSIDFLDGAGGTRSGKAIEDFQKNRSNARVLILRIDSADSAGWNMQKANHVMFLSPFLTKTQYDYESTMVQAIGRAHRHGQEKTVSVYHFLMARTMDVNVIQERKGGRLAKLGDGS